MSNMNVTDKRPSLSIVVLAYKAGEAIIEFLAVLKNDLQISSDTSVRKSQNLLLAGHTVVNLFFEDSTRTRTTFEIAGKRLGASVINLNTSRLSTRKGETVLDTVRTLEAMDADIFVVRDNSSGTAHLIARHVPPHVHIINAGDGRHAHPTQAMLDMFTIRAHKGDIND